jgi:hypothetical protein
MSKKRIIRYEPPFSRDFSVSNASGQVSPQGRCTNGTTPYEACQQGPTPTTTCSPGTIPGILPDCFDGLTPGGPTCNPVGSVAYSLCRSGSAQA